MKLSSPPFCLALALALGTTAGTSVHAATVLEDPSSGCKVTDYSPSPALSVRWSGSCVAGQASGDGVATLTYPYVTVVVSSLFFQGRPVGKATIRKSEEPGRNGLQRTYPDTISFEGVRMENTYVKQSYPDGSVHYVFAHNDHKTFGYIAGSTANKTKAAYRIEDDDEGVMHDLVSIVRFNPSNGSWDDNPSDDTRAIRGLAAYAIVTGSRADRSLTRCPDDSYTSCSRIFDGQIVSKGYSGMPDQWMAVIDSKWADFRKSLLASQQRQEAIPAMLAKAPAEQLFALGSKDEERSDNAGALEAYRALITRFPKSNLVPAATSRMAAVQGKLDAMPQRANSNATQPLTNNAADLNAQRAHAEEQARAAQEKTDLAQQQRHDACTAKADECNAECERQAANSIGVSLGTLLSHNQGNLPGAQSAADQAAASCRQCDAMRDACD